MKKTLYKTMIRETVSYNKTIGAFVFGLHQYKSTDESDDHLGFAAVKITVHELTNPDVSLKRMHQLYNAICQMGVSL